MNFGFMNATFITQWPSKCFDH